MSIEISPESLTTQRNSGLCSFFQWPNCDTMNGPLQVCWREGGREGGRGREEEGGREGGRKKREEEEWRKRERGKEGRMKGGRGRDREKGEKRTVVKR